MGNVNLTGMKYVVFADYGYDGSSLDMFTDEESAQVYADKLTAEGDYECLYIGPIGTGAKLYGEPHKLAHFYTDK